jgi:hypothetical protein
MNWGGHCAGRGHCIGMIREMKPGKICKKSGKRAYGSHEEAVRKGMQLLPNILISRFSSYLCAHCKCWHLTTKNI